MSQLNRFLNVAILCSFVAACKKDNDLSSSPRKIDSIARAAVNS